MGTLLEKIDEGLDALLGQVGEGGAHVAEQRPGEQLLPLLGQPQVRAGWLRELKLYVQCISKACLWAVGKPGCVNYVYADLLNFYIPTSSNLAFTGDHKYLW